MADSLAQGIAAQDVVTAADVRALATATGPCITLVIPIPNPLEIEARLKNALRAVENRLAEMQVDPAAARVLIAPVEELAAEAEAAHVWASALVAMRSPGVFRHFWLREPIPEVATAGERFEIRPLLAAIAHEQRFFVLALSRSRTRLLRATPHTADAIRVEGVKPPETDFEKGAASEKMAEKAREDDHRFLKEVEHRVTSHLQDDSAPLILAGVEHETALYRRLNRYPHLWEEWLPGSPDNLKAQALHERGWEIVSRRPSEALVKALAEYRKHAGSGRVLQDAGEIARAAAEGRLAGLFLAAQPAAANPDDPMNLTALQTVAHGGWAFELAPGDMPAPHASAAALLRF